MNPVKNMNKIVKKLLNEIKIINNSILKKKLNYKNKSKVEIDPVTKFDILIEKKIRSFIKRNFSNHSIVGEEFKNYKNNNKLRKTYKHLQKQQKNI